MPGPGSELCQNPDPVLGGVKTWIYACSNPGSGYELVQNPYLDRAALTHGSGSKLRQNPVLYPELLQKPDTNPSCVKSGSGSELRQKHRSGFELIQNQVPSFGKKPDPFPRCVKTGIQVQAAVLYSSIFKNRIRIRAASKPDPGESCFKIDPISSFVKNPDPDLSWFKTRVWASAKTGSWSELSLNPDPTRNSVFRWQPTGSWIRKPSPCPLPQEWTRRRTSKQQQQLFFFIV